MEDLLVGGDLKTKLASVGGVGPVSAVPAAAEDRKASVTDRCKELIKRSVSFM